MEKRKPAGFNLRLPEDLHKELKIWAAIEGRTMTEIITELVRKYLQKKKGEKKK